MKPRNTLIALLVLIALGGYVYFVEYRGGEKKKEEEQRKSQVFAVKEDDVASLEVKKDASSVALLRDKDKWRISAPIATDGDSFAPGDLARALAELKKESTVEEKPVGKEAYSGYGLDPASLKVSYKTKDGKSAALEVGKKNPITDGYYARVAGEAPVFLISGSSETALDKDLFALRNKKLLEFSEDDVNEMELNGPNGETRLVKEKGRWRLVAPVKDLARQEAVRSLLGSLRFLEAARFVSDDDKDLGPYGLNNPTATVTIRTGAAAATQTLIAGIKVSGEENAYVKRGERPGVAIVSASILPDLQKGPSELREKAPFAFDRWDVKQVDVTSPKAGFRLTQPKSGEWQVADLVAGKPGATQAAAWRPVDDYLKALTEIAATDYVDAPPSGVSFDPPALTVGVSTNKEPDVRSWRVAGPAPDGFFYVKDPDRPVILKVPADTKEKVVRPVGEFLEKPTAAATPSPAAS